MKTTLATLILAAGAALAAPVALAQEEGETRPPKMVSGPDTSEIQKAVDEVKQPGACRVVFIVSTEGKPDKIEPECTPAEYGPFAARAVAAMVYEPELVEGVPVPSNRMAQAFNFGVQKAAEPEGTPPQKVADVNTRTVELAFRKVKEAGSCRMTFTVKASGEIADLVPNCQPEAYNDPIRRAAQSMKYKPGVKDGQAVDWPGVESELTIGARNAGR